MAIWKFAEHELDTRVEKNFIVVEESRRFDENETRTSQSVIEEYRYREEDIAFTCEEDTIGFPGSNPYVEVIWKRNGKLLPSLRRYQQELIITPLPYDVYNYTHELVPENYPPMAIFKVIATLKIYQPLPCLRLGYIDRREDLDDAKTKFSNEHFDIFISHVDWKLNLMIDQILPVLHGHEQRVCTSELDIPPNLPILSAVSTAIDNSTRYIIIWSSEYKNDELKLNMEVEMIGHKSIYSKKFCKSPLLIIKLDGCPLLPWMRSFEVHNWTTTLSREDHLRRLSRWVQKGVKRDTKLSLCKQSTF
ncbi:hypothetical protein C0Q70_00289 [Pomacea canaliculata]|uniref:TIR domain-containing protein n=1 Tax=Pomacea canaliculata TaxID=400727 RepID=A0A2T7PW98_POMCA|nr:hypothetical protein C0Q70_00289 [Pomacea canaliculata]